MIFIVTHARTPELSSSPREERQHEHRFEASQSKSTRQCVTMFDKMYLVTCQNVREQQQNGFGWLTLDSLRGPTG